MSEPKVWMVAVDMGYGHQRAAYPLKKFAYQDKIITANNYEGIPASDRLIWANDEKFYNFISRFKSRGWLGRLAFNYIDRFQKIDEFYPLGRRTEPTAQLKGIYQRIKKGWGQHLIKKLNQKLLPLITPFFTVAHMAEYWGYQGPIYLLVTDSDISRAWAPLEPAQSKICYLASTERVVGRLKEYGVLAEKIFYTGFPLPEELVGPDSKIAKENLRRRLLTLDPLGQFKTAFGPVIENYIGSLKSPIGTAPTPTLAFAVGGAGAQVEIGCEILGSLAKLLREGKITIYLIAGVSEQAATKFNEAAKKLQLEEHLGKNLNIIFTTSKEEYFQQFNEMLSSVDILWTKPSELSFYAALGLPIVIAPPVGSQEIQNRKWLLFLNTGLNQLNPKFAHQWLVDWISNGHFAEMALEGFIKMERNGVANIRQVLLKNQELKT